MPKNSILIVTDNFEIYSNLQHYFVEHSYNVFHAISLEKVRSFLETNIPEIVIVEPESVHLGRNEIRSFFNSLYSTKNMPLIFLIKYGEEKSYGFGQDLDLDEYITIPFDIEELEMRVQRSISRNRTNI